MEPKSIYRFIKEGQPIELEPIEFAERIEVKPILPPPGGEEAIEEDARGQAP